MKFIYQYRSSDNEVHTDEIRAVDKDGVYRCLRERGIRPRWVKEAPGFFNKLLGRGKRWIAIVILTFALMASLVWGMMVFSKAERLALGYAPRPFSRGQLYGDPSLIQSYDASHWRVVYTNEADRVMALFARPGSALVLDEPVFNDYVALSNALSSDVAIAVPLVPEVEGMNRMVEGMKSELRTYLSAGGTVQKYVERLYQRQNYERNIYEERLREFESLVAPDAPAKDRDFVFRRWELINEELRSFGLPTISMPEEMFQEF